VSLEAMPLSHTRTKKAAGYSCSPTANTKLTAAKVRRKHESRKYYLDKIQTRRFKAFFPARWISRKAEGRKSIVGQIWGVLGGLSNVWDIAHTERNTPKRKK